MVVAAWDESATASAAQQINFLMERKTHETVSPSHRAVRIVLCITAAKASRTHIDDYMASDDRLEALLARYAPLLRRHIAQQCPARLGIQAADVEQEAMVRLWRALRDERNVIDGASYVYRIAVTATIDAVRRVVARREEQLAGRDEDESMAAPKLPPSDPRQSPEAIVARRRAMEALMKAIAQLSANRRRCVELHLQGFTTTEIAELEGWTEAKARNLVYRGVAELREMLKKEGIEPIE